MKKIKMQRIQTEEQLEVKKFLFVLLGLVVILVGVYFFTRAFVTKDLMKKEQEVNYTTGTINYDVVVVGTMLNRSANEYYVMAFSSKDTQTALYNNLISKYTQKESHLKVYYLDTANELNKKYVATEGNASTSFTSLDTMKFGTLTLVKVKDGKVTKFLTTEDKIKKELDIQ